MVTYSTIRKGQLEGALRLDAEYYQPEYLMLDKTLCKHGSRLIFFGELLEKGNSLTGGATPLGANYPDKGIKFLRVQNIMSGYFDFSDVVYIDENVHNAQLKRSRLVDDDVLLTITGVSYGKASVYKKIFGEANINQHSVRMHFVSTLIPEYVSTFLNSKYGHFQSDRKITGNSRPALAYGEIRNYKIPAISLDDQREIKKLCEESLERENNSIELYNKAENLLLEELGLKNVVFEDDLSFVVDFSDIKTANRIDAEYYQPKYQKLIERIKSQNAKTLGELVSMKKGVEPGSEAYQEDGKLFIRVSSVSKLGIEAKDQKYLTEELYQELKKGYEPKLGDILLTKDATPGIAYVIKEPLEGIISGGILDLTIKDKDNIESEYLALCISSIVGQWQAQRDAGGSIISHWKPEQVKNLIIPILPMKKQKEIAGLVRKSHEARKKSKELLEEAKRKVEEMIEKQTN